VNSSQYWITARVNQSVPQLFSAVLGNSTGMVAARATASLNPSRDCMYVMSPSGTAVNLNGTVSINSACGLYINSSDSHALNGNGASGTLTASEIDIVGSGPGYSFGGTLSPSTPSTGVAPIADPLASLPAPSVGSGCDFTNKSVHSDTTLNPGIYCGGISVVKGTATFNPGLYILKGGGMSTQDSNSIIVGSGVTFYNTYDATHNYAPFSFTASSSVTLSAPTTGTYAGVLIMEDRSITTTTCGGSICSDSFQGGANSVYTGIIYGPKSSMSFSGNPSLTAYTIIVSYTLTMSGASNINNDYSSLPTGNPIKVTALVE